MKTKKLKAKKVYACRKKSCNMQGKHCHYKGMIYNMRDDMNFLLFAGTKGDGDIKNHAKESQKI